MSIPVLACPVINGAALLSRMIHSIDYPVNRICIIQNGTDQGVIDILAQLGETMPNLTVFTPGRNLGVSASWNYFLKQYHAEEYILIVGSDIAFASGDLRLIDEGMRRHPEMVIRPGCHGLSFFGITPECVNKVGYFDENFFAYHEDEDYIRRVNLAGLPWADIGKASDETVRTRATHGESPTYGSHAIYGDASLMKLVQERKAVGTEYYRAKWGGVPGQEVFKNPNTVKDWKPVL